MATTKQSQHYGENKINNKQFSSNDIAWDFVNFILIALLFQLACYDKGRIFLER